MKALLRKLKSRSSVLDLLYRHVYYLYKKQYRYFYSLWFNYKYLPKQRAKLFPIIFCKGAYAEVLNKGKLILEDCFFDNPKNKVVIGDDTKDFTFQCERTYLHIEGELRIKGHLSMRRGGCWKSMA